MIRQPDIIPKKGGFYVLDEDYSYTFQRKDEVHTIIVRHGFKYDGASVPRWLWSITGILPDGIIRPAALIHDAVYHYKGRLPMVPGEHVQLMSFRQIKAWSGEPPKFSRKEADKLFLDIMELAGVGKTKRTMAYLAVRLAGWTVW